MEELEKRTVGIIEFDGRNDWTKMMLQDEDGKLYPSSDWEEHYSITLEPGGNYLTHFVPEEPGAIGIANGILAALKDYGLWDKIYAIGGDSTNTNTGWKVNFFKFVCRSYIFR